MNYLRLHPLSAGFAALFLFAGGVNAGVIDTSSVTFDFTTSTFSGNLSQFDPSLGTLTSVALGLNSTRDDITAHVSNSGTGPVSISADLTFGGDIALPGWSYADWIQTVLQDFNCSGTNTCSNDEFLPTVGSGTNIISPLSLTPYIGTGTVGITIAPDPTVANVVSSPVGGSATVSGHIFGSVFLEYTYTANTSPAPEPATIALMGCGLGALAFLRRRL